MGTYRQQWVSFVATASMGLLPPPGSPTLPTLPLWFSSLVIPPVVDNTWVAWQSPVDFSSFTSLVWSVSYIKFLPFENHSLIPVSWVQLRLLVRRGTEQHWALQALKTWSSLLMIILIVHCTYAWKTQLLYFCKKGQLINNIHFTCKDCCKQHFVIKLFSLTCIEINLELHSKNVL